MISKANTIAVIPARSGSKRVPHKNIRPLLGRPLLTYTIQAALDAGMAERVAVSTDSQEIADIAKQAGAEVIRRPTELATDTASTESVLMHSLDYYASQGKTYEWILTLPPTSPLRDASAIRALVAELQKFSDLPDCLMSVTETREDLWQMHQDGTIGRLFPKAPRRQQERDPLFIENSAIYLTSVAALRSTGSILGGKVRGMVLDPIKAIDMNHSFDFQLAEFVLSSLLRKPL